MRITNIKLEAIEVKDSPISLSSMRKTRKMAGLDEDDVVFVEDRDGILICVFSKAGETFVYGLLDALEVQAKKDTGRGN